VAEASGSQGARRRKRRKTAQGGAVWTNLISFAAQLPIRALRGSWNVATSHRRTTTLGVCALGVAIATHLGVGTLETRARMALPDTLSVEAPNRALKEQVERLAADTLARTRVTKGTREALLAQIGSRLDRIDAVDTYEVRAGLDRRMQIRVSSQVPLFVLEGQGKERVLVGHRMKILQRKLGAADYPHLLRISTPDFRVSQALPRESSAGPTPGRAATSREFSGVTPLNFAWLANQGGRVREAVREQKMNVVLEEITWRSVSGFVLDLKDADAGGRSLKILLGETDLEKKIARLPELLADLRTKNLAPAEVDLNYGDKALIRLSEAEQAAPL